ncbi:hypothetical protein ABKV19_001743 [Rosa sericea]|uniref:Uncharacterized protein n=1 Tax=Rosa chinensis TaxID=74649 RepID=A0A2P6RK83_ROSCH|nr:hypothetical protein RchiOBHm_Chr2g0093261 [Rosa chinensis]
MAEPPTEHHIKRFKFIWRVLMISNLALGGYMFIGAKKRDIATVNKKKAKEISIKKHKAVVEEVPSSPPAPPPTTTTTSETWDL